MNRIEKLEQAVKLILAIDGSSQFPIRRSEANLRGIARPETVRLGCKTREQLEDALAEPAWAYGKLRNLSEAEVDTIREAGQAQLLQDVGADARYAQETICHLADETGKGSEYWLEMLTTESDMWAELLGFDPRQLGDF